MPVALQAIHVAGAGIWLGTLLVVMIVGVRGSRGLPGREPAGVTAALVNAFSPLAVSGVAAIVLTGTGTAYLYLGQFDRLWRTTYGLVLVLKLLAVGAVVALGHHNYRRLRPRLGDPGAVQSLWRGATAELILALLALAITAVLVGLPMPGD